ncbi:hypothetical protein OAX95_00750 [bacterium]|nr:hypothetical protein [bacterium]
MSGASDPERGRLHRPDSLQVCATCGQLRGPYEDFDNLCECDRTLWDREPTPRAGDLYANVAFCRSCISALAPGSHRFTSYYCDDCRPQVIMLNMLARRCVVPIGPHSIMNGVFANRGDEVVGEAQILSFCDQLHTLFREQGTLHERTKLRTRARLEEFGVTEHAIAVAVYLDMCATSGWDAERGFIDFVMLLEPTFDDKQARELWELPSAYGGGRRAARAKHARVNREMTEGRE